MLTRDFPRPLGGDCFSAAFAGAGQGVFLLDSALDSGGLGRMSFAGIDPFLVLRARGRACELVRPGGTVECLDADPLELLRSLLSAHRLPRGLVPGLPFVGGAVGWLGYEAGAAWEKVPPRVPDDLGLPDMEWGLYDAVAAHDPATGKVTFVAHDIAGRAPSALLAALEDRILCAERLRAGSAGNAPQGHVVGAGVSGASEGKGQARPAAVSTESPCQASSSLVSDTGRKGFMAGVERIRSYIASGDVYQVNLAHRYACHCTVSDDVLYARLRALSPAPFGAYLNFGYTRLLSVSPERFLSLRGSTVSTRPIKGTRPRGATPEADARLRAELEASAKDHAELLMITDLERNDLGRVCRMGSVHVPVLRMTEAHPTVWHLVSEVTGELAEGRDAIDLLRASFPGGSITGAPKVRAMQVIAELERNRRGPYTGSIGYLGLDGDADLNIAIRTVVRAGDHAVYHVGGGITWDSDPQAEYEETLAKGRALRAALEG